MQKLSKRFTCLFSLLSLAFMLTLSSSLLAQNKQLSELYNKREYEKLLKKCDALIAKDIQDIHAHYFRSLAMFEMSQSPEKYVFITDNPLEQCLISLSKARKFDNQGFMDSHKDTVKMIKQYAETVARETIPTNKAKAIRIYRHIYKINSDELNTLTIVEIYLKADDISSAYFEIDNLYAYHNPTAKITNQALLDAPMFMMRKWMFKDLFVFADKYQNKFPLGSEIGNSFYNGIKASLDTMYDYKDKMMFFDYCKKAIKLYPNNIDLQADLKKKYLLLMKKTLQEYEKISTTKTWRDSILLRDFFKYSDMAMRLTKDSQFVDYERKVINKYLITLPYSKIKMFQDIARDVVNAERTKPCKCRDQQFGATDTMLWSPTLEIVAREHAREMFAYNYTEHTNKAGQSPKDRVDETDLKAYKLMTFNGVLFSGAVKVEECISAGFSMSAVETALDLKEQMRGVVTKWKNSRDGDCEKIMNYENNMFGLSMFGDRWVLLLAKVVTIEDK